MGTPEQVECKRTQPIEMRCTLGHHDGPCYLEPRTSPKDDPWPGKAVGGAAISGPEAARLYMESRTSMITVNEGMLATAFRDWDAAYRTNPDHFWSTVKHLVGSSTYEYGEACAAYMMHLLRGGDPLA